MFALDEAERPSARVEDREAGARGALIECTDQLSHEDSVADQQLKRANWMTIVGVAIDASCRPQIETSVGRS